MESHRTRSTIITIASSHKEPTHRINRIAPTAYAFWIHSDNLAEPHWGYGGARDTQEMLAQGLNRAAELAFIDDENARIEVLVRTLGFQKYLTDFVPKWRPKMANDPFFSRNNLHVWKKVHTLYLLGGLKIRLPQPFEKNLIKETQSLAQAAADKSLVRFNKDPRGYVRANVLVTDEDASDEGATSNGG